jgi:hypothetical protein
MGNAKFPEPLCHIIIRIRGVRIFSLLCSPYLSVAKLEQYNWQRSVTIFKSRIYREQKREETWREYIY